MKSLDQKELQELLIKNWMTHDAMWFFSCLQKFGIEKTNELNLSAIELLAAIEIRRMQKVAGIESIDSYEKLKAFMEAARCLAIPDFMEFTLTWTGENTARWVWRRCFAYDGVTRLGVADGYRCGVIYRIECWFKALGVRFEAVPGITGCLMHETGKCEGEFRFFFNQC